MTTVGKPMYFLECALGQFTQTSPLTSWKFLPVGQGVGYGMIIISLIVAIYYNVIIGKLQAWRF
jgi:SNF family Na+-dependent transporter